MQFSGEMREAIENGDKGNTLTLIPDEFYILRQCARIILEERNRSEEKGEDGEEPAIVPANELVA